MTKIDKVIKKFFLNPTSVSYKEIEKILKYFGFEKIQAKGSHVKFKHAQMETDLVVPVHNGDCKTFYKEKAKKEIRKIAKHHE